MNCDASAYYYEKYRKYIREEERLLENSHPYGNGEVSLTFNQPLPEDETEKVAVLLRRFFEEYLLVNYRRKNKGYAQPDVTGDAFANFREAAKKWGMSEEQYWGSLWGKHVVAIETWVRTGKAPDKIHRILNDVATYTLMLIAKLLLDEKLTYEEVFGDPALEGHDAKSLL